MNKKKIFRIVGSVLLFGLLLFLAFNKHSKSKTYSYQSVIWADRAGYNVYLPAAFNYGFDARLFPDSIDVKTGSGFSLNRTTGQVRTKYSYGVALLQTPFYLGAQLLAPIFNMDQSGYSPIYFAALYVAAVSYLFFGMLFLYRFLRFDYGINVSRVAITILFLGTNLYQYSIEESGMSHVYSFFLFSVFLYLLRRTSYLRNFGYGKVILFGLVSSLIVLVRPTNVIFLSAFFFLDATSIKELSIRLKSIFHFRTLIILLITALIIWLPQFIYWNYLSGQYIIYPYDEEGFNWMTPKFLYTWFAPLNGLFLYTPLYVLLIIGMVKMWLNRVGNGMFLTCLFVVISYVFASWWDWSFGCSLGARSFVEYLAVFSLSLCYLIDISMSKKQSRIFLFAVLFLLIGFNLKLIYSYDMCFFGDGIWDWNHYLSLIVGPTK